MAVVGMGQRKHIWSAGAVMKKGHTVVTARNPSGPTEMASSPQTTTITSRTSRVNTISVAIITTIRTDVLRNPQPAAVITSRISNSSLMHDHHQIRIYKPAAAAALPGEDSNCNKRLLCCRIKYWCSHLCRLIQCQQQWTGKNNHRNLLVMFTRRYQI